MWTNLFIILGGIGLFLFGMQSMTGGIKELAGPGLRRMLGRFTTTPATGALSGAAATAVVQSSSATTVTAVGFVGAGLLTLPQALGIIFGANIGTTVTGWMVMVFGFRMDLGTVVLPLLLAAALARMFFSGRAAQAGSAVAGFALIFIGLDMLQDGMAVYGDRITPADFPDDSLWGRLQLVMLGAAITALTQSSSAGVAAALVALAAGSINFPQAAAMVIGMNIGTTATALMGAAGGSHRMHQTAMGHVIYNLATGCLAFGLLDLAAWALAAPLANGDAQLALVIFHTAFNVAGVALLLPFTNGFARMVQRLIPEPADSLTAGLDERLLADRAAAIDAATGTMRLLVDEAFALLSALIAARGTSRQRQWRLARLASGLSDVKTYLARMPAARDGADTGAIAARHTALLHLHDHLVRLVGRLRQTERIAELPRDGRLAEAAQRMVDVLERVTETETESAIQAVDRLRGGLRDERNRFRADRLAEVAAGGAPEGDVFARLDAMRWLHRVAYHVWRILVHRAELRAHAPVPAGAAASEGPPPES
ncbi:Na/Pi cotransporter family protein [Rhodovulum sp. YNF3179]|uniref:Na/Pi cotransporter family protein n=1 Tax=Rhodovulum sp. YNF3179 TaxID=3425127 RepID=UPI003D33328F